MSIYHIDGFTTGSNPSTDGGYTITDEYGNILKQKFVKSEGNEKLITNNYTEFLALHDCLVGFCKDGDTIFTDSQNNISWSAGKFNKKSKRRDLIPLALRVSTLIKDKSIHLEWVPREENFAGLVNEYLLVN